MEYTIMQANLLNGLSLAYIGDAIYELYVRQFVLNQGYCKVNDLHKQTIKYTSGISQANFMHKLLNSNILTEEEIQIFKRGRNSHVHTSRKNMDIQDYLDATGFEALIGYLYLTKKEDRIFDLLKIIFTA